MGFFLYSQENAAAGITTGLELITESAHDLRDIRFDLMGRVLDQYFAGSPDSEGNPKSTAGNGVTDDDVETILDLDPRSLSVTATAKILDIEDVILDTKHGLVLAPSDTPDSPAEAFYVVGNTKDELVHDYSLHEKYAQYAAVLDANDYTHHAYQKRLVFDAEGQPSLSDEGDAHYSLGYMDENGHFDPRLTVLHPSHPVVQRILGLPAESEQ